MDINNIGYYVQINMSQSDFKFFNGIKCRFNKFGDHLLIFRLIVAFKNIHYFK